jgi:transcription elongation GreA/GreB family factor
MNNKRRLIEKIIAHLDGELQRYASAARSAQADATDDQSRAENKYDTRGLEASYLAHGQSRQALETEQARQQFAALVLRDFDPGEAIGLGALIALDDCGERLFYFIGPSAGGTEVLHEDREVMVITALSPLGRQLVGKRQGERLPNGARVASVA